MASRIEKRFQQLNQENKKAFAAFVTAGDGGISLTEQIIYDLEKSGVSIIELGVPFSDPMADGEAIQLANQRSLKHNTSLKDIFALVKRVRKKSDIPILLMGYYNPIYHYGLKKYAEDAKKAGIDGTLVVDLPPEEAKDLKMELDKQDINLIFLLAPTSDEKRIKQVEKMGSGFVYYVSLTGVTGAGHLKTTDVNKKVQRLKKKLSHPVMVGFGISTPQDVKKLSKAADGVVVGSAFVKKFAEKKSHSSIRKSVSELSKKLVSAL